MQVEEDTTILSERYARLLQLISQEGLHPLQIIEQVLGEGYELEEIALAALREA